MVMLDVAKCHWTGQLSYIVALTFKSLCVTVGFGGRSGEGVSGDSGRMTLQFGKSQSPSPSPSLFLLR